MTAKKIDQAVELLLQARLEDQRIAALPNACRPKDEAEAYLVQDRSVDRMLAHCGGDFIGYKIGHTSVMAQKTFGLVVANCRHLDVRLCPHRAGRNLGR